MFLKTTFLTCKGEYSQFKTASKENRQISTRPKIKIKVSSYLYQGEILIIN